ncbi:nuclear transport factor 2 family protein [Sphingomonas kaistensis]|uniref:Nuclear transport factor 2 family protein n=1 Tax=Sphingomonas kaistensis TaxID=298708 RepID=A0ABZ2G015_9SPHN
MKYRGVLAVVGSVLVSNAAMAAQTNNRQATAARAASEEVAVKQILSRYKAAIEKLDATATQQLFAPDSAIFETGGSEGTYANYLTHHLGPELKEFKRFGFSDYKVDVRFEGPVALATETYNYRIETKSGETAERRGVATSVLKKIGRQWKILSMHNSARKPRGL